MIRFHRIQKTFFCLAAVAASLIVCHVVCADEKPDWVRVRGKSQHYPEGKFFTGFGCAQDEDIEKATAVAEINARKNLAGFFQTHINSILETQERLTGGETTQYVKSNITASSTLQLLGVRIDTYQDKPRKLAFALAIMDSSEARRIYSEKSRQMRSEIASRVRAAREAEGRGDVEETVHQYLSTYPMFAVLEEVDAVRLVLGGPKAELQGSQNIDRASVSSSVDRLLAQRCVSVDDLAVVMACRLAPQIGSRSVTVAPFTYKDTEFTSEFSRYFAESLRNKLSSLKVSATVSSGLRMRSLDPTPLSGSPAGVLVVTGTYVEKGDDLKVFAVVSDPASGERSGAADSSVPLTVIQKEGLALKPANFPQALQDQKVFAKDEVVGSGLNVEAWTNKGDRNLVIRNQEKYRIYIRVNQPAYIRILYHLATGQRVLLPILGEEEYFVDASKVNKVVELPETYVVAPPFGAEVLQVFASTAPFPHIPLEERLIEGQSYKVLNTGTKKDLEDTMATMRGFRIEQTGQKEKPLVAETRVTMTTMR